MSYQKTIRREFTSNSLRLVFLCPAGWKARESQHDEEIDIHLLGPRNDADTYSTSLAVSVMPAAGQTVQAAAQELLVRFHAAFPCETRGPIPATVAGRPAFRVEVSYSIPLPLNNVTARPTPVQESTVFARAGDHLIELRYAAAAEEFAAWQPAFETLLASFELHEEVSETSAASLLAVRETPATYHTPGEDVDDATTPDRG